MSQPLIFSKLFVTLTQKSVEDRRHFGKTQIKIWFFAQFVQSGGQASDYSPQKLPHKYRE